VGGGGGWGGGGGGGGGGVESNLLFPCYRYVYAMNYLKLWRVVESRKSGAANVWHPAFRPVSFFFLISLSDQSMYIVNNMCVCVCMYIYIYICAHTHIWVETVCALLLVPNNTASETFLHKSGAVRSVDWLVIVGAPPCADWAST